MPSGGARRGAGAKPDPSALRRDRKDDAEWLVLPREGYQGPIPRYPLPDEVDPDTGAFNQARKLAEAKLWREVWRKPQATVWSELGMVHDVAIYVRGLYESGLPGASAGLRTWALRAGAELGLTLPGMLALRWVYAEDELAAIKERQALEASAPNPRGGARARLEAMNG